MNIEEVLRELCARLYPGREIRDIKSKQSDGEIIASITLEPEVPEVIEMRITTQ